ncbi:MAG: DMT family transporter [Alphaproteobacteria bacterium]|nr:DMT family transporter [Alphaproteobacteria bacterium]MBP7757932.1 DMT family transporter [Alphaproteobacteria bacterium]MBP7761259.1 DMT family transporter [Alphaproteobacteria bacterium]MBP7903799.1 DMT family transporter [Alphaproteobacteria bacterium]
MFKGWNDTEKAIALSMVAFAAFSLSDALRKYTSVDYPVVAILFWQAVFGLIILAAVIPYFGGRGALFTRRNLKWHLLRGLLMAVNTSMSLTALSMVPIMDAYTIFFLTPFITTVLSIFFFKEQVGRYRMAAILCGFLGGVVAFRPGFEEIHPAYGLALACCFTFGLANLVARRIGGSGNALPFAFWPFILVLIGTYLWMGGAVPFYDQRFMGLCLVIGFCYGLAVICVATSYTLAPTSVVAPYQYVQMLFGLLLGYLLFGHLPDAYKIAGGLIITASGLFLFWRERRRKDIGL